MTAASRNMHGLKIFQLIPLSLVSKDSCFACLSNCDASLALCFRNLEILFTHFVPLAHVKQIAFQNYFMPMQQSLTIVIVACFE